MSDAQAHTIDLNSEFGLGYLRSLVMSSPTLSERADMEPPLTDWWKNAICALIDGHLQAIQQLAAPSTRCTEGWAP